MTRQILPVVSSQNPLQQQRLVRIFKVQFWVDQTGWTWCPQGTAEASRRLALTLVGELWEESPGGLKWGPGNMVVPGRHQSTAPCCPLGLNGSSQPGPLRGG